jgi:hypothetical protein
MRGTILEELESAGQCPKADAAGDGARGSDNGEHGIAPRAGCGDCGEEFAEASVLSGLAGGELSRESLQLYAAQYYRHVEAFPGHLRVLAVRTEGPLQGLIRENLAEEENPAAPHPKLWRDFAAAVGVGEDDITCCPAGDAGGGAEVPRDLRGPARGRGGGGAVCV